MEYSTLTSYQILITRFFPPIFFLYEKYGILYLLTRFYFLFFFNIKNRNSNFYQTVRLKIRETEFRDIYFISLNLIHENLLILNVRRIYNLTSFEKKSCHQQLVSLFDTKICITPTLAI